MVDEDGLTAFARLLREYHDATTGFTGPDDAAWAIGATGPPGGDVICHGDFGPWNVVWQGQRPVGLVDFDFARPAARVHDIAYALQYVAPFRDDTECLRWLHHPQPPVRGRRLERFCTAYGLSSTDGIVDAVIREQRENVERIRRLALVGQEPQATWVAEGYLRDLADKLAWSRGHRYLFE
ncbi:phosphotransferase [Streptomyces bicolor]|uniref:phosphotransferase n=1 Tax=Streptomyces bicolor TaxID=66874 RepID=UPI000AE3A3E8|nr:phosphotransferase [Streptomyces bicolor]